MPANCTSVMDAQQNGMGMQQAQAAPVQGQAP